MKKYWLETYSVRYTDNEEKQEWISIHSLDYHPELLYRLAEMGVIEINGQLIRASAISRIQKIFRLRGCLGVNLAGADIILALLERIENLQQELRALRDE